MQAFLNRLHRKTKKSQKDKKKRQNTSGLDFFKKPAFFQPWSLLLSAGLGSRSQLRKKTGAGDAKIRGLRIQLLMANNYANIENNYYFLMC